MYPKLPVSGLRWNFWSGDEEEAEILMDRFIFFSFLLLFNQIYINLFLLGSAYCQLKHTFLHSGGSV